MRISLTAGFLRELQDKDKTVYQLFRKTFSSTVQDNLEREKNHYNREEKNVSYYPDEAPISISLLEFNAGELKKIDEVLRSRKAPEKQINNVHAWMESLKSPLSAEVTGLQQLEKLFEEFVKKVPDRWLVIEMEDGNLVPHVLSSFAYQRPRRDTSAYFSATFKSGLFFHGDNEDDDKLSKLSKLSKSISIHNDELTEEDEETALARIQDMQAFFDSMPKPGTDEDELEEGLDEEDREGKKAVRKTKLTRRKLKRFSLAEILARNKVYFMDEEARARYWQQMKAFAETAAQLGKQYTAKDYILAPHHSWSSHLYLERQRSKDADGIPYRLIVDMDSLNLAAAPKTESDNNKAYPLPYAPLVKMYDITKHRTVAVHIDSLIEYKYDKALIGELVMEENVKGLLSNLIQGEMKFQDIITGKSGGMIVLCSGRAGTGKTLTAEVYSEFVEKPLYSVQSMQLGLDIENIEKNLEEILRRAARWNAILLIDECDTYVYERGKDMHQNAIVGTFLRLLEYYNGLLFLTTNRHDIIDSAIVSRCTAHIKYSVPKPEMQRQIFKNLMKRMGINAAEKEVDAILKAYPDMVGRDIRNLLKLVRKCYHKGIKAVQLTAAMIEPMEHFIPFLTAPSVTDGAQK